MAMQAALDRQQDALYSSQSALPQNAIQMSALLPCFTAAAAIVKKQSVNQEGCLTG